MDPRFSRRGFTLSLAAAGAGLLVPRLARADVIDLRARLEPSLVGGRLTLELFLRSHTEEAVALPTHAIVLRASAPGYRAVLRTIRTDLSARRGPALRGGPRMERRLRPAPTATIPADAEVSYGTFIARTNGAPPERGTLEVRATARRSSRVTSPALRALCGLRETLTLPLA